MDKRFSGERLKLNCVLVPVRFCSQSRLFTVSFAIAPSHSFTCLMLLRN